MSIAEKNPQAVDNKRKHRRGKTKGRIVDINALLQVQSLLGDESRAKDLLIEHLHKIQDQFGHLSAAHLVALASEMKLAPTEVYEVASFYHHFDVVKENDNAPPALTVRVCESVSCEMAGAQELIGALESSLGNEVRVQRVPCVGRCDMAPVAVVGQNTIDHAQSETVKAAVDAGEHPTTTAPRQAVRAARRTDDSGGTFSSPGSREPSAPRCCQRRAPRWAARPCGPAP